jgi:single-stranded DNA-binding protein
MPTLERDAEYLSWSEEARYRFDERMGISFGDAPISLCPPEGVEACREAARAWMISERKTKNEGLEMLTAQAVGRMKENAKVIATKGTNVLVGSIEVKRRGFGARSGDVFGDTVKFAMFGKSINELAPQLVPGVLVEVVGKPEVEAWVGKQDGKPRGTIKISGTVSISCEDTAPQYQPQEQAGEQPQDDGDVAPQARPYTPF